MTRLVTRALALAPLVVAGAAAAHPGHATPHLIHEGDAMLGWWIVGTLAVAAVCAAVVRSKNRF